jgi:hypothetical protein
MKMLFLLLTILIFSCSAAPIWENKECRRFCVSKAPIGLVTGNAWSYGSSAGECKLEGPLCLCSYSKIYNIGFIHKPNSEK